MKTPTHAERNESRSVPAAKVSIKFGKRTTLDASMTTAGLLSVGALVSGILLSSAVIVAAAGRKTPAGLARSYRDRRLTPESRRSTRCDKR